MAIISVQDRDRKDNEIELVYTKEGIQRLALVLRCFCLVKNWSDRQFSQACGLADSTVNRYMRGQPVRAKAETVQAFAKVVYKVVKIQGDMVYFDDTKIYGDDWVSLARIATINPGVEVSEGSQDT